MNMFTDDEILSLVAQVMTSGIKQEGARFTLPESMIIELVRRAMAMEREQREAEPKQEPVAWLHEKAGGYRYYSWQKQYPDDTPLYAAPPRKEWIDLTDEEIKEIHAAWAKDNLFDGWNYERAIEAKLREKNA